MQDESWEELWMNEKSSNCRKRGQRGGVSDDKTSQSCLLFQFILNISCLING